MSHQFKIGEFSIEVDGSKVIVRDAAGWIVENVDISESGGLFRLPNGDLIDMADLMADGRLAEFQTASGVQGQVPIVPGSGIFTPMTFESGFFGLQGSGVLQGTDLSYLLAEEDRPRALSSVNQDGGKPTNTNHRVGATGENDDWPGLDVAERPIGSNVDGPSAGGSVPGTNALPAWTDDAGADTSIGSAVPPTTGDDSSGNGSENAGGSQGEETSSNAGGNGSENAGGSQGEETSSNAGGNGSQSAGGNGNGSPNPDNGHGNDVPGVDSSNPGNGNGVAESGQGHGAHSAIVDLVSYDSDEIITLNGKTKTFGSDDADLHAGAGIDVIDATNGASQTITLSIADILNIVDDDHHLTIMGGKGDVVNLTDDATGTWSVEVTSDATIYSWTSFSDPTQQAVIEVNNQVQSGIA